MRPVLTFLRSRAALLLGLATLGLVQTGCAHPVWVEPSVQVRVGGPVYGQVYGQVYGTSPGVVYGSIYSPPVVATGPLWGPGLVAPPRVAVPAPLYRPGWGYGGWHGHRHFQQHGKRHGDWR